MNKAIELYEFLTMMKKLKAENNKAVDDFCKVCGDGAFESPIIESGWKYLDVAVLMASKYFNDDSSLIPFFMYDNDFGNNNLDINGVVTDSIGKFIAMYYGD